MSPVISLEAQAVCFFGAFLILFFFPFYFLATTISKPYVLSNNRFFLSSRVSGFLFPRTCTFLQYLFIVTLCLLVHSAGKNFQAPNLYPIDCSGTILTLEGQKP